MSRYQAVKVEKSRLPIKLKLARHRSSTLGVQMVEDVAEQLVAEYLEAKPTRQTSRVVVKSISAKHGLTDAKVRGVLVRRGVYLSMPKDKSTIEVQDRRAIVQFFDRPGLTCEAIKQAADEFGYNQDAILNFRAVEGLPVLYEYEQTRRDFEAELIERSEAVAAKMQADQDKIWDDFDRKTKRDEAQLRSDLKQINREHGFFAHPLWPLQVIVIVVIIGLILASISALINGR